MAKKRKAEPDDSSKIKLSLLSVTIGSTLYGVGRCVVTIGSTPIPAICVRAGEKKLVSTYEDCLQFLTMHGFPTQESAETFLTRTLAVWDRNEEREKKLKDGASPAPTGQELHKETIGRIVDGVLEDAKTNRLTNQIAVMNRLKDIARHMQAAYDDDTAIDVLRYSPNARSGIANSEWREGKPFPFGELAAAAINEDLLSEVRSRKEFQQLYPVED